MTIEEDNVARLAEAYQRWHDSKGGSINHWLDLIADDIVFRSLAEGGKGLEFTEGCSGKEQVRRYLTGLTTDWQMLHYKAEEFIAQGDRVVMLGSTAWVHRENRAAVETPKADFWRFRDGKAVEFFEFYDTAKLYAAAQPSNDLASSAR